MALEIEPLLKHPSLSLKNFHLTDRLVLGFLHVLFLNQLLFAVDSPVPPEDAHRTFQIDDGLSLQLVAAEPLIASPVAMAWDDTGRLFVVENRGYPVGMPNGSPGGVVAMLEDADGDGRMDQRTVFADGFSFPNGILAWNGGFFVTCAPDVFFLADTDGDGRADVRRVVLTGFDTSSTTQLRIAHPTLGPDGWIYLTSGLTRAGHVTSPLHPDRQVVKIASDSRFDPFTYLIEPIDGRGQFGQTFDDWGNRFHCMNRVHIQHAVLPSRFLKRNPNFAFNETVQNVPEGMVDDLLKSKNVAARIYPISDNLTTADSHAGTFSAACSVHVYRGDGLPVDYYGDVFACDPTGNLVHRDRLTATGPTFFSKMVNESREFLASRDNWFRPVNLATGPDGALYVADMYRGTIEHPQYLPDEVRKRTSFEAGRNRGRIWKVQSTKRSNRGDEALTKEQPSESQPEKWVADLGHPNVWQRERAMKMILANRMTNAMPALIDALPGFGGQDENEFFWKANRNAGFSRHDLSAVKVVNALNAAVALSGWNYRQSIFDLVLTVPEEIVSTVVLRLAAATVHPSASVRLAAWRHLREMEPDVADEIVRIWSDDPNPAVRFQIALALGSWEGDNTTGGLINIGLRDGADRWTRAAFISGIKDRETTVIARVLRDPATGPAPELAYDLGRYFGRLNKELILSDVVQQPMFGAWNDAEARWRIAALGGGIDGVGVREMVGGSTGALERLGYTAEMRKAIEAQAARIAFSDSANPLVARSALTILAVSGEETRGKFAKRLLVANTPDLVAHGLGLLVEVGSAEDVSELLSAGTWLNLSPNSRALVIDGLLRRAESAAWLFRAIEGDRVSVSALTLAHRDRLKRRLAGEEKLRAEQLFTSVGGDRMKVYETFKNVASISGNANRGRELFKLHCASCHRLDREGSNVGPDLFGVRNQSKETILIHVLAPNREVLPGFAAVTIEVKDSRSLTGIIRSENENSVTLVMAQGIVETIPRADIDLQQTGSLSLMPDGFEDVMNRAQLADLLAHLKGE